MRTLTLAALSASIFITGCATTGYRATPQAVGDQSIRYNFGAPTISDHGEESSVSVVPVGAGPQRRLMFDIAVINQGEEPANFGVENLSLSIDGEPVAFFTVDELADEARRQRNAQIAAAVLLGAAAAYSAQQAATSTSHGTYSSPYGTSTYTYRHYNAGAAIAGQAAATAATGLAVREANDNMDDTLANLGQTTLRTTTVDPGYSFGGRAISRPIEVDADAMAEAELSIEFGGERFAFTFEIEEGANAQPIYNPAPGTSLTSAKGEATGR